MNLPALALWSRFQDLLTLCALSNLPVTMWYASVPARTHPRPPGDGWVICRSISHILLMKSTAWTWGLVRQRSCPGTPLLFGLRTTLRTPGVEETWGTELSYSKEA